MELILLQKVRNLGTLGDKVTVKPGYGRNYLLPQGKAVRVNAANLAAFEQRRAEYEAKANTLLSDAEARKARLAGVAVTIAAHASAEGKLFGSVGPRDIAEALVAAGHEVHKNEVILGEGPLRNVGEYDVVVSLHADVQTTVKVVVVGDK
ncbi:50S ribosomal protein L9 [Rhodanobacter sp. FW510-R12]|uniref:50S ribosomal protein L9 n=1 Tax=unclassified Rhodanobacter TaxID=2621553 RepID=UPI0007A9E4D4|nr:MULTISPECIES: 50S ribosomal protein L9 [unclassified Rhodanobacter]KZC16429.1 50S ribosomal protein L9 [Rhodanobacter sp. FW104-R8]KZC28797.1 50S ribosomal protein L9 [Rhodanobacter sp. FW510-T8]KZC31443.1 50S ribosomal protein L9 [Rhodanobacter sp. FW510-R10]